jgi:uncharacterized repeat protein (TIGR03803 family)
LAQGSDGNLYGTAQFGGAFGVGTVFRISPTGAFSNLYSFTGQNDGSYPSAALVQGPGANFYGTTYSGGTNGGGTVFMMTPGGSLSNLWTFSGPDGQAPLAALVLAKDGNFYGATAGGGTNGANGVNGGGTLFAITPGGNLQVLHSFAATNSAGENTDGAFGNTLAQGSDGNFYGTCNSGGANDAGTVFRFSLLDAPTITQQPASQTNSAGTAATFTVVASGGGLGYQWFKNNQPLSDAGNVSGSASALLTLGSVSSNDVASYLVVVTNSLGSATSAVATLAVVNSPLFLTQPKSVNAVIGSTIILSASAIGPGTLAYQWQLNSTNLSDTTQISGVASNNLTLANVSAANAGSYTAIAANGFGAITSFVAVVNVGLAPAIAKNGQPVSKLNVPVLSNATFTVTVTTGTPPLAYQWQKDGIVVTDGGDISGSSTSSVTVNPVTAADAGTYSVVIANAFGSTTSAGAVLGVKAPTPTVTITSPTANARTTSGIVTGTASDQVEIVGVIYFVTNLTSHIAMANNAGLGSGTSNRTWLITNALAPGSNFIEVASLNSSAKYSATNTQSFFYEVPFPFAVTIAGSGGGTVKGMAAVRGDPIPGTNSQQLIIGDAYTVTATPNGTSLFANWTGDMTPPSSSPVFSFVMASNFTLQANFTNNFFLTTGGSYNGLFFATNDVTEQQAGLLANLVISSQGAYSATLWSAGYSYPLSGAFDNTGHAAKTISRSAQAGGPLSLQMTMQQLNGAPPEVIGTVTGTNWSVNLTAVRAVKTTTSAEYTMVLPPAPLYAGSIGYGYGLITNHLGMLTISGAVADSTIFSQTVPISATGDVPLFANVSKGGVLLGWLNLTSGAPAGSSVTWLRQGLSFDNIAVEGSLWTNPPPNTPAISLPNGQLIVTNPAAGLDFEVSVNPNNTLVKAGGPANSLTGSINPKTGLLTVTFGTGVGTATLTGYGAVLQNTNSGAGFFITKTNYGTLLLQP